MALPRLESIKYTLTIPSTQEEIEYRPYLVKEEKILMVALETQDQKQMMIGLRDVILSCTEGRVNVEKLPLFDMEYIFLKIRSKSVGEVSKIGIKCNKCDSTNKVEIDLESVEVNGKVEREHKIELTADIGMMLKYPLVGAIKKQMTGSNKKSDNDNAMATVIASIDYIYDKDSMYSASDETTKNLVEFIDSLTSEQFLKITKFFENMPKLEHNIKFKCQDCKKNNDIHVEGLQSFF